MSEDPTAMSFFISVFAPQIESFSNNSVFPAKSVFLLQKTSMASLMGNNSKTLFFHICIISPKIESSINVFLHRKPSHSAIIVLSRQNTTFPAKSVLVVLVKIFTC